VGRLLSRDNAHLARDLKDVFLRTTSFTPHILQRVEMVPLFPVLYMNVAHICADMMYRRTSIRSAHHFNTRRLFTGISLIESFNDNGIQSQQDRLPQNSP
jgi:hypothetical protein